MLHPGVAVGLRLLLAAAAEAHGGSGGGHLTALRRELAEKRVIIGFSNSEVMPKESPLWQKGHWRPQQRPLLIHI